MSNALVQYETEQGQVQLSPDIVKKYLVNGNGSVTDQEVVMFLNLCKYQKLNPFLREAYLIKFGSSPATIVTGKEVFTKRASKLPICEGWEAGVIVVNTKGDLERRKGTLVLKNEELVGGWCKVYRTNWKIPVDVEVSLSEFNKGQSSWKTMPATMIRKVAIVSALREAFPEDFQGLYDSAEMPVDQSILDNDKPIIPADVVKDDKPEQPKKISPAQAKRLFAKAQGYHDIVRDVLDKSGYESTKDINAVDYDTICEAVEAAVKERDEGTAKEVIDEGTGEITKVSHCNGVSNMADHFASSYPDDYQEGY